MLWRVLADAVVVVHAGAAVFAILGGLLVLRWRRVAWAHVPLALWVALIEFGGWICPLTPLENWLRRRGGEVGYDSGFVDHYIVPVLYPVGLTRPIQVILGVLVLALNVAVYGWVIRRWRRKRRSA